MKSTKFEAQVDHLFQKCSRPVLGGTSQPSHWRTLGSWRRSDRTAEAGCVPCTQGARLVRPKRAAGCPASSALLRRARRSEVWWVRAPAHRRVFRRLLRGSELCVLRAPVVPRFRPWRTRLAGCLVYHGGPGAAEALPAPRPAWAWVRPLLGTRLCHFFETAALGNPPGDPKWPGAGASPIGTGPCRSV